MFLHVPRRSCRSTLALASFLLLIGLSGCNDGGREDSLRQVGAESTTPVGSNSSAAAPGSVIPGNPTAFSNAPWSTIVVPPSGMDVSTSDNGLTVVKVFKPGVLLISDTADVTYLSDSLMDFAAAPVELK